MSKIRRVYSYKGEFIGLENYKYLRVFYNKDGEIRKPSKNAIGNTLRICGLIALGAISTYGQILVLDQSGKLLEETITLISEIKL